MFFSIHSNKQGKSPTVLCKHNDKNTAERLDNILHKRKKEGCEHDDQKQKIKDLLTKLPTLYPLGIKEIK